MTKFEPLRSLRAQLIFGNIAALALLLGVLGVVCHFITISFLMMSVDRELKSGVAMYLRRPPQDTSSPAMRQNSPPPADGPTDFSPSGTQNRRPPPPPSSGSPYRAYYFDGNGQAENPYQGRPLWDAPTFTRALRGETVYVTAQEDDEPLRVLSMPGYSRDNVKGVVQNAYPLRDVYRAADGVNTALLLLLPLGLLGAAWVGAFLTGRVLRRVRQTTQAAERIGAQDLSQRLPVSGSDEFSEMATTFNGILTRLDTAFDEQKRLLDLQRRFTADASHELKTPLTTIKGSASLALSRPSTDGKSRQTFQAIDQSADLMTQLVQDLLLLARSDAGQMGREPKEVLIHEILERAAAQTGQDNRAPITFDVQPGVLSVTGSESELVRLFRNLLENAVRYTPIEGQITVTARLSDAFLFVSVTDTGVGIAPEHLPHLGERFYRADASRTRPTGGTGLGLSICRSIVDAHGGTLTFASLKNVGTTVTVRLPAPNSPA